jgi:large subunit ribosomal protein L21
MYAVVETGGKQYRLKVGDAVQVERIEGGVGDQVTLDQVLLVSEDNGVQVGRPRVEGYQVLAEIVKQDRHKKIQVFKKRRRKKYRRAMGHRQDFTELKVIEIKSGKQDGKKATGSKTSSKKATQAASSESGEEKPAEKVTTKKEAAAKPVKKTAAKKPAAKKTAAKKPAAKKTAAKKPAAKKTAAKKPAAKKTATKKPTVKKTAAKKPAAKKEEKNEA